jgi:hypothetical protein
MWLHPNAAVSTLLSQREMMVSRAWQTVWQSLQVPERVTFKCTAVGWLAVTGLVVLILWVTGPITTTLFPNDTIRLVDLGYRIALGLKVDVDFVPSYYGPFFASLMGFGVWISGAAMPVAIHVTQGLTAVIVGSLIYVVALGRLRLSWALFLMLVTQLLLILATPLGYRVWREFGYAMFYNALCYALLAGVFTSLLIPRRDVSRLSPWLDVAFEGLLLSLLLLTKMSYGLSGLAAWVVIRCIAPFPGEKRLFGLLTLVICGILFFLIALLTGGALPYLAVVGATKTNVNPLLLAFRYLQYTNTVAMALMAALIALAAGAEAGLQWRWLVQVGIFATVVIGAFMLGTSSACQDLEVIPFVGLAPLGAVVFVMRAAEERALRINQLAIASALALTIFLLAVPAKDALLSRFFLRASVKTLTLKEQTEFSGDIPSLKYYNDAQFQKEIVAGVDLIRDANPSEGDVLWAAWQGHPVEHLVGMRPARGSFVFNNSGLNTPPSEHPFVVSSFLPGVDWILKSRIEDYDWQVVMGRPREKDYFDSHFSLVSENEYWILYRQNRL